MSFRYYPMYLKGNPQLRVYLPNFWMKLVKPDKPIPPFQVQFKVPVEMTNYDIRNYLEKIYKIPVVSVHSKICCGKLKKAPGKQYIIKDDDYRLATISLPQDNHFTFPNIFPEKKLEEEETDEKNFRKSMEINEKEQRRLNWDRQGVPSWFGI